MEYTNNMFYENKSNIIQIITFKHIEHKEFFPKLVGPLEENDLSIQNGLANQMVPFSY